MKGNGFKNKDQHNTQATTYPSIGNVGVLIKIATNQAKPTAGTTFMNLLSRPSMVSYLPVTLILMKTAMFKLISLSPYSSTDDDDNDDDDDDDLHDGPDLAPSLSAGSSH